MLTDVIDPKKLKSLLLCWLALLLISQASLCAGEEQQQPNTAEKPTSTSAESSPAPSPVNTEGKEQQAPEAESAFDLLELRVKGNTMLEDKVIEKTVYPFLGPKKTIDTVISAQKALEEAYRNVGYQTVTVDIPEQDVENGVVTLQVVEGKVSRLRVTDSRYFSLGRIKSGVPEVAEGKVPNFNVMQKQVEALESQSADRKITPIMRAGDTPGTLEVDLKVKDKFPLHGRLELNGRNTSSTSDLRLVTSLHYDNLWQRFHSASLMYQVSPENNKEVDVWAGTYVMPVPETDAKLAFYAVSSSSDAQVANANGVSVVGIGEIYGLRFIKPLPGFDSYSHSLTLGADYKSFGENIRVIGNDDTITPIDYLPFTVQYNSSVGGESYQATFNAGVTFGVRGLVNDRAEFENKRLKSQPDFAYLTLGNGLTVDLPWQMEFASRVNAQIADSPLISNEQFSLGGMQSVRGYFETQALADDGFTGSLELRSPRLVPASLDYINKLRAVVFVDGGYGSTREAISSSPSSYSLASAGLGLRFQAWKYLEGVLDLGFPLLDLDQVKAGDPKFHFLVAAEF